MKMIGIRLIRKSQQAQKPLKYFTVKPLNFYQLNIKCFIFEGNKGKLIGNIILYPWLLIYKTNDKN
jgi:hypothetical protein